MLVTYVTALTAPIEHQNTNFFTKKRKFVYCLHCITGCSRIHISVYEATKPHQRKTLNVNRLLHRVHTVETNYKMYSWNGISSFKVWTTVGLYGRSCSNCVALPADVSETPVSLKNV
jgi:hypothetical protein